MSEVPQNSWKRHVPLLSLLAVAALQMCQGAQLGGSDAPLDETARAVVECLLPGGTTGSSAECALPTNANWSIAWPSNAVPASNGVGAAQVSPAVPMANMPPHDSPRGGSGMRSKSEVESAGDPPSRDKCVLPSKAFGGMKKRRQGSPASRPAQR